MLAQLDKDAPILPHSIQGPLGTALMASLEYLIVIGIPALLQRHTVIVDVQRENTDHPPTPLGGNVEVADALAES